MGSELPSAHGMMFDRDSCVEMPLTNMNSAIVPVVVIGPEYFQYVGTAFNIAWHGLFVTASHVVDDALSFQALHSGSNIAVMWVGSGAEHDDVFDLLGGPIYVSAISKSRERGTDLALLRAGVLKDGKPFPLRPILPLSTVLPKVGELISGAGYPNPSVESDTSTTEAREITVEAELHVATGEITEVFEQGRDSVMLPAGGFQTEAIFESAMSGGPVFNQDGYVCGVILFSLRPDESYPRYTSYASFALSLYPLWISDDQSSITVYELAQQGIVKTDDHFGALQYSRQDGRVVIHLPRE